MPSNRPVLIAIFGKSASGKDTFCDELCGLLPDAHKVVLDTTRPIRPGESEDAYNFMTLSQMGQYINSTHTNPYAVNISYRGWRYGVPMSELEHPLCIGVFSPKMVAGLSITARKSKMNIVPIYMNVDFRTRMSRSVEREGKLTFEILRRSLSDECEFKDFAYKSMIYFGRAPLTYMSAKDIVEYLTKNHII